jgi:hypothetical protein
MNEEYINSVTLEYLLNPLLYSKINDQKNASSNLIFKDIKFYRKRICQMTKDMCKGDYINDNLKSQFLNYANAIIYYLKQLDEKDIYQEEYNNLTINKIQDISNVNVENKDLDNEDPDHLLINQPDPINNLDNFIKKINIKNEDKIIPQRKVANINDPNLKRKGVKKGVKKENL